MSNNKTLQMSSMRTLKHKYLGSGRDTAMQEHTTAL